jgi:hypothetical protein
VLGNEASLRRLYFASFALLTFFLGSQVLVSYSHLGTIASGFGVDYWLLVLISAVPLLILSSNLPVTRRSLPPIIIAIWLALFLLWGFSDQYFYPFALTPWLYYIDYGLIVGVPLVVSMSGRIASLGLIKLMVYSGFLMILAYYIFGLLYNYDWGIMYNRSGTGMNGYIAGLTWVDAIKGWLEAPDWLFPRLLTYAGLGYLLARRRGLLPGIVISLMIALVDNVIYWLAFIPGDNGFETPSFVNTIRYGLPDLLWALVIEVGILGFIAAVGALSSRVRLRYIPESTRQRHNVRRILPRADLN